MNRRTPRTRILLLTCSALATAAAAACSSSTSDDRKVYGNPKGCFYDEATKTEDCSGPRPDAAADVSVEAAPQPDAAGPDASDPDASIGDAATDGG